MAVRLDEYVDRLRARLARKLAGPQADQKAEEIRSHLFLAREKHLQDGILPADAERRAVQEVGPDRTLADDLIRVEKGLDRWPKARWIALPAILVGLTYLFLFNASSSDPEFIWFAGLNGVLAIGLFLAACIRSRKWLLFPLLAAIFPVSLAAALFMSWRQGQFDPEVQAKRIAGMQAGLDQTKARLETARKLAAGPTFTTPAHLDAPLARPVMTMSPYLPWSKPRVERSIVWPSKVQTAAEAERRWKAYGALYVRELEHQLKENLASVEFQRNLPRAAPLLAVQGAAILTGLWAIPLALLNALAIATRHIVRRTRERAWLRRAA